MSKLQVKRSAINNNSLLNKIIFLNRPLIRINSHSRPFSSISNICCLTSLCIKVATIVREQQQDVLTLRSVIQHKNEALKKKYSELEVLRQANIVSCASSEQSIRNKVKQTMDALRKKVPTDFSYQRKFAYRLPLVGS